MARRYDIRDLVDMPPYLDLTDPRWQFDAVLERWKATSDANQPTKHEALQLLTSYHTSLTRQHADRAWEIAIIARLAERWQG